MSVTEQSSVYALLTDGTTVEIRPARPDDFDAVQAMHEGMSPDNAYLRFFILSRLAAEPEATRVCRAGARPRGAARAVQRRGRRRRQLRGAGRAAARRRRSPSRCPTTCTTGASRPCCSSTWSRTPGPGVTTFTGLTLAENAAMLRIFTDAGLPAPRQLDRGVVELTFPLPGLVDGRTRLPDAVAEREHEADVASLRHVFPPGSVAVIGASRRPGTVGRAIWDNIRDAGYAGPVYAVNPHARRSAASRPGLGSRLPEQVDLAVIAVPAAAVSTPPSNAGSAASRWWSSPPDSTTPQAPICWPSAAATACG